MKTDDSTILIKLTQPDSLFPYRLATVAHILPPLYYQEVGREKFSQHPIGTGAFQFLGFTPEGSLRFLTHRNYWNQPSHLHGLEFHFLSSAEESFQQLKKGTIHFAPKIPGKYISELAERKDIEVIKKLSNNTAFLMLNTKKEGILQNSAVRHALRIGLNMGDILERGYHGHGRLSTTLTHEGELFHPEGVKEIAVDSEKARKLLRENGVSEGTVIKIAVINQLQLVGEMVAQQLRSLGFNPDLRLVTPDEEKREIVEKNKLHQNPEIDMLIAFCAHRFGNGAFPMLILTHSQADWSMTCDSHLDHLLDEASTQINPIKQKALFQEASKYISDNNYIFPIFQFLELYGIKNTVTYEPHISGYLYFKNLNYKK